MKTYDFFIAHAGPDLKHAKQLCWHLEDLQYTVYLDAQALSPGTQWPTALRDALYASRVIIVLISAKTENAFYEIEEIVRAIQQLRENPDQHHVIPVMLEKLPEGYRNMPYGAGILQTLDATRSGGLERVAHEIDKWFAEWDSQTAASPLLTASNYRALGAALRLDRYPQWSGVLDETGRPGHVFFLLHGARDQHVDLFVERIQHYVSQESSQPHGVYRVRFNLDGIKARCGADWLRHLRSALGSTGEATHCLAKAAKEQRVFVILGQRPLDRLDAEQQDGLGEFVGELLPKLLRDARPAHDVRVLLALDYDPATLDEPLLVQQAKSWASKAETAGALRFRNLPKVKLPTWDEVEDYLHNEVRPPPTADVIAELRAEYDRLCADRPLSFKELTDLLDRLLQDA